jgi:hypothetical protein
MRQPSIRTAFDRLADGYIALGLLCWLREQYDEAVFNARKAVQLAPGSTDVAELASFILTPSGYPEEGLVLLRKAITFSPNHPPVYLGSLGNAYRLAPGTAPFDLTGPF